MNTDPLTLLTLTPDPIFLPYSALLCRTALRKAESEAAESVLVDGDVELLIAAKLLGMRTVLLSLIHI